MTDLRNALTAILGPKGVIADPADLEPYVTEERGLYRGRCQLVARPADTAQVAAAVALCAERGIPIVPQGGNTGLVGGGVPEGGVVLALGRMNRIRAVDPLNHTLIAEAGVILADVQKAAEEADLLFPLSLAAEGSCQIGGNLATNAGGVNVLRYGNARDLTLGLEVVLPDGRIWDGLRGLRKDNTGYDLKHLFIGSEGTLGIITAAVLKLHPRPRTRVTALAAMAGVADGLALLDRTRDALGESLVAFEYMARTGLEFATWHVPGAIDPFEEPHGAYALIELTSPQTGAPLREGLEAVLEQAFEAGVVEDAVIADSQAQAETLWHIRESIPEAQKHEGGSIKHDVAVPVSRVAEFVTRATALVEAELPGLRVCPFGHLGDGNIHFNLSQPLGMERDEFLAKWTHFNRIVHDLAVGMGGSFSAEHGIGRLKIEELARYKSPVEIDLMRALKHALDPAGRLNPGKMLP